MDQWEFSNGSSSYDSGTNSPSHFPVRSGGTRQPGHFSSTSSQNGGEYSGHSTPQVPMNANGSPAFQQPKWNPAALLNPRGTGSQMPSHHNANGFSKNTQQAPNLAFQFDSPGGSPQTLYSSNPSQSPGNMSTGMNGSDRSSHVGNGAGYNGYANGHSKPSPKIMGAGMNGNNQANLNGGNGAGFAAYANGHSSGYGPLSGMGHMLERMHNVTDRSMVPQKRRKVYDEREESKKSAFNGGGKNGVLGEYIREKREEGSKEAAANGTRPVETIDDDEVEIVSDTNDKEVCYGRIEGVEINAIRVPTPKQGVKAVSSGVWPQVKIVLRRRDGERTNIIHAVDSTRQIVGTIDVNTAIGLTPLLDSKFGIRTAARILARPMKENDPPPGTEGISCRYGLDLNLYGPKKYTMQVGRHLSQKNLWLRTPLLLEAGVELHNPHVIQRPPASAPRYNGIPMYSSRQQGPQRTTEELRNEILGMFDNLERSENLPEMDPDPRITTDLLRHQKQGLYFMTNKERERVFGEDDKSNSSFWRPTRSANGEKLYLNVITGQEERQSPPQVLGGILADMMGLGKTLSILSLVVTTLDIGAQEWSNLTPCANNDNRDLCPTRKGKTALPKVDLAPLKLNAKTTLLVSPLSTITNWEEQIKQHVKPGTLSYYIYHGAGRIKDVNRLANFDLVITTYGSVASEFVSRSKNKPGVYPLEEINWFRVVLDEAHMIREQTTQQCKAICRLSANRRWAVTGTPVQNRLEDLGALLTFLRIKPFDERGGFAQYIMSPFKMCDPEILPKLRLLVDSITLRRLKDRIDLPPRTDHIVKLDFSPEERMVYDVFSKNASDRMKVIVGQAEKNLGGKTYAHILQSILRLRLICAHGRDLLSEEDLKMMDGLSKDSAIDLSDDDDEDQEALSAKQAYDMFKLMKETNADLCFTCQGKIGPSETFESDGEAKDETIGYMTPCYHILCTGCITKYKSEVANIAGGRSEMSCPICQQFIKLSYFPLKQGGVEDEEESRIKTKTNPKGKGLEGYSGPHTKTKALISDLIAAKQESEMISPERRIKSVVFSGWTSHLDLIQFALQENGITFVRLDGKMSRTARGAAMDRFREDESIEVILVSITAGGLGLNLTIANKVYVMEPQYNPAAEAQAVDRVHRLGQKREVTTVRYIMNDSFEEKMLILQDKKKKLASLSMDGEGRNRIDKAEAARKRLEDLRSLFK